MPIRQKTYPSKHATWFAAGLVMLAASAAAPAQPILSESFDSGAFPPAGWSVVNAAGGPVRWDLNTAAGWENATGGTGRSAIADAYSESDQWYDTALVTPSVVLPGGAAEPTLSFRTAFEPWSGFETADVDLSTDGVVWQNLLRWEDRIDPIVGLVNVPLTDWKGATVSFRFHYYNPSPDAWDFYWQVDDVEVLSGLSLLPGDADRDGTVGVADYLTVKQYLGTPFGAIWENGDFDLDGDVDPADLASLEAHFGQSLGGLVSSVPEPMTAALLAAGAAATLLRRRKR